MAGQVNSCCSAAARRPLQRPPNGARSTTNLLAPALNIGFVSTPTGWGGGENLLAQLVLALRGRGVRAVLATPRGSAMARWAERERVESIELPGRGRTPAALWRLRRGFASAGCEIALLNDPHAITYGGLALTGAGVPRVGVRHTVFPVRSGWKHNRLLERVVAVSAAAREVCLAGGVDAANLRVIHGGVEPRAVDHAQAVAVRKRFANAATDAEERQLVAVGSLLPVKGFDTLIHAVAKARDNGQAWRLWIAGEGPQRDELQSLANERGVAQQVELLGFVDPVSPYLAAADAFVSASHSEGLSLVLVEAMLAGAPIAATPVGGAREVLGMRPTDTTSPHAALFTPGDGEGARRAIEQALTKTEAKPQRLDATRTWANKRFSIDRMAAEYLELFEEMLASPDRSVEHAA
ncbi:2-deoxystreptamine glucosyltransferase [Planctomycetes bacterium MalM25]|nr:2-deoxystreptamine glucosyltransferase [Planctomycetes bacterium MalM25]